jgi:phosphoglycolate phosphatase
MHVLFFDIDGTLINTRGSGVTAIRLAFAEVFRRPVQCEMATAGRTDRSILRDLFLAHGVEDTAEHWSDFHAAYVRHLAVQLPLRDGCLLPGVMDLLETLMARRHVALGLLTGNTTDGARLKLQHFGLQHYFTFGGFGEHHMARDDVARDALTAAQRSVPWTIQPDRVWVVGDTPLDIQCARHIGAQAVAVATGGHDRQELARAAPDLLLDNLGQAEPLLQRLETVDGGRSL